MTRTTQVEVHPPKWQWRLVVTIVLLLVFSGAQWGYSVVQGPIEGSLAVQQAEDDAESYMVGKAAATANVYGILVTAEVLLLLLVWVPYLLAGIRYFKAVEEAPNSGAQRRDL